MVGGSRGAPSQTTFSLISDPQSSGELLRAPGFPLTLSAHSACFTGRILEAGMSLQARADDSCSRAVPGWNSGREGGPSLRGRPRLGGRRPRWALGCGSASPGEASPSVKSGKGQQPWAEGPGTAQPYCSQAGRTLFRGKQLNPNQTPFPGQSIPARSCWMPSGQLCTMPIPRDPPRPSHRPPHP